MKKVMKKYVDASLAVKNLPLCAVPKVRKKKKLPHDPKQVAHLHAFQAKMHADLKELYKKFGRSHRAEATDYLKQAFGKVHKSLI